jgi:excisionase family DNA binding protein
MNDHDHHEGNGKPADELPDDLVGLSEATRLIPSVRPGRKVHVTSLYRWIAQGRLRAWRRGKHLFVSRADLAALHQVRQPAPPSPVGTKAERRRAQEWARQTLEEFGLKE